MWRLTKICPTTKKICPSTKDKHLSFVVGQIFFVVGQIFFVVGQIFVRRHTFVSMKLLQRTKIVVFFSWKTLTTENWLFPYTKWVKILLNSSKLTSLCKVRSWDPSNITLLHEKARQMKKTFCFNFCAYHCLWKNVSKSDLRCPQLPQ